MGTMSYGADAMDEVAHQLAVAFGADQSKLPSLYSSHVPESNLSQIH